MANEREEIQIKNGELDEEIAEYEQQLLAEQARLTDLTEQAKMLSAEVDA